MIRLEGVCKQFGRSGAVVDALVDVEVAVAAGETAALRGPSGSGKSTLLAIAAGLDRPTQGIVEVDGVRVDRLGAGASSRFRAEKIGFVFQRIFLTPYLNVLENVLIVGASGDRRARAEQLLHRFGLADRLDHTPGQLSVGECQRAAFARALVHQPKVLLADEPTGNLDADSAAVVISAMEEFRSAGGAVIVATHDDAVVASSDRTIQLVQGRVVKG